MRTPLWLMVIACIALAAVLAPFAKRHKTTKTFLCDQCGIQLRTASDKLVKSSAPVQESRTLKHTELSRWFASHITTNCQHTWRFNHSSGQIYVSLAGFRVWNISGSSGSSPTPTLIYFSADDRTQVEQVLRQSPDACQSFIHASLQKKEVVVE